MHLFLHDIITNSSSQCWSDSCINIIIIIISSMLNDSYYEIVIVSRFDLQSQ